MASPRSPRRFPPPWSFLFLRRLQHLAGHGVCRRISHRRPNDLARPVRAPRTLIRSLNISRPVTGNSRDQHLHPALRTKRNRKARRNFRLYLSLQRAAANSTRVAYQMAFTGSARHQVSESIPLNCAIAGEHPVLNCVAGDNGAVSFCCRICLHSTSVQQTRATPSAPNICWSRR